MKANPITRHINMDDDINHMNSTGAYESRLYPYPKPQLEMNLRQVFPKNLRDKPLEDASEEYAKDGSNAPINIICRATPRQMESHAQGENSQYISTGNANGHGLEELRTYPANAGKANDL